MHDTPAAVILGLVQGFTEFLPISSTGHLIITSALMDMHGERISTFEVVIQLGSILAVVFLYRQRFWGLLFPQTINAFDGCATAGKAGLQPSGGKTFAGIQGLYLLFLTSLPAGLVGLAAHSTIKSYLFNPISVSLALAAGAVFILFAEYRKTPVRFTCVDEITPALALGIGCFQCLSLWPGFSRSASTIMGGLLLGARRELAAEYSFLAAVPIMVAATGLSLYKSASLLTSADIPFFLTGTIVSFAAALAAIKILLKLVSRISFRPFAWYRLALAPLVFWFWM